MDVVRHLPLSQSDRSADAAIPDRRQLHAAVIDAVTSADPTPAETAAFLAACATKAATLDALAASTRVSPRQLVRTVRAGLAFADARGTALTWDPRILGVAALAASASAPADRRAAIAGLTVAASDAGWSFGRGPVASAPAEAIVRFLTGLSDTPPRPDARH